MNKTIWKFDLEFLDMQPIKMPENAEILSVGEQDGKLKIWALVKPDNAKVKREFEIFGTGHNVYCDMGIERKFLGTVQMKEQGLVWHLFERID